MPPVAKVESAAICYGSIQDAAIAGILASAAVSNKVEYGGAVFRRDSHCFVHSVPVTNNLPNQVEYVVRFNRHHMPFVGVFHTHVLNRYANEFSKGDVAAQRRLGVPSYIGTLVSRSRRVTIRVLTGGDTAQGMEKKPKAVLLMCLEGIGLAPPAIASARECGVK